MKSKPFPSKWLEVKTLIIRDCNYSNLIYVTLINNSLDFIMSSIEHDKYSNIWYGRRLVCTAILRCEWGHYISEVCYCGFCSKFTGNSVLFWPLNDNLTQFLKEKTSLTRWLSHRPISLEWIIRYFGDQVPKSHCKTSEYGHCLSPLGNISDYD